jgi:N-acetylglucosaminyl-diphospho-decaprenol L-rhamnosyltransferase
MASPSPRAPSPKIAIVTVSFGSAEVLPAFTESVLTATARPVLTVVADNKADAVDNVRDFVAKHGLEYLALPHNPGYGAAVNAAVATLPESVDWVLVSNPDVVLAPGSLDILVETAETTARIGSVGPLIRTAEGDVYPSARAVPSLRTGVGHALFVNLWGANPWTRAYRRDTESSAHARETGWLSGACMLVRRSAFSTLGGFDEGFFMYFEDVDLGYRLGKAGYINMYEPAAVVIHSGAHSTTTDSARMVRAHHESARRFLNKKYRGMILWPIRAGLRIGLAVRSALVVRKLGH